MANESDCNAKTLDEDGIQYIADTVERANTGDATALDGVRQILDEFPDLIEQLGGDLATTAESALIAVAAGERLAMAEALRRNLRQLEQDLAGPRPSATERLLVRRVTICWLQSAYADCMAAQMEDAPIGHADYLKRCQDRAHKRLLSGIKTLAAVRKLALPAQVQVNIDMSIEEKDRHKNLGNSGWPSKALNSSGSRLLPFGLASES